MQQSWGYLAGFGFLKKFIHLSVLARWMEHEVSLLFRLSMQSIYATAVEEMCLKYEAPSYMIIWLHF